MKALQRWLSDTRSGNRAVRKIDKVTVVFIEYNVLDATELKVEEKRSAMRFMIYKFPCTIVLTNDEDRKMRLIVKESLTETERKIVIETLEAIHKRGS